MHLRAITPDDIPDLAGIYRQSARILAAPFYTSAQIDAWSSWPDDDADFTSRLKVGVALVSMENDQIAAFAQLAPDDTLALLYTNPPFARRGHATALLHELEQVARTRGVIRLHTTASHLSRTLFEKHGFTLNEIESTSFKGVEFQRFKMAKRLARLP